MEKTPIEHGLKWFEYHAGQRLAMVRFYLTLSFGIATAISYFLGAKLHAGSALMSVMLTFVSVLFWQLDIRGRQLTEIGEKIIQEYWESAGGRVDLNPITSVLAKQPEGLRFKTVFTLLFGTGAIGGIGAFGYSIWAIG